MAYTCCDVMRQNIVNKDLKIAVNDKPQGLHGNKIKIMNRELFNIYVRFIERTENGTKTSCTITETLSLIANHIPSNYLAHKNIGRRRGHNNYNIIYISEKIYNSPRTPLR